MSDADDHDAPKTNVPAVQDASDPDVPMPGSATPRLYSLATRYTDQFLAGEDGPDLLCDDPIAAVHFALTTSTTSQLAVTCRATTDGTTWTPLPLRDLRAAADAAIQKAVKTPFYPHRPHLQHDRPLGALRRLVEHAQADWLDGVLRPPPDEASRWVPDEPHDVAWSRAGQLWAAVWGDAPAEPVVAQLTARYPNPPYTSGLERLRDQATAVTQAVALAHAPTEHEGLAQLHAVWLLLHQLEGTVASQYEPGTDLGACRQRLLERIAVRHPDTAAHLDAVRDHRNAPAVQAAAHAYLERILPAWPRTAAWTNQAHADYAQEVNRLRRSVPRPPADPPIEGEVQQALNTAFAPVAEPADPLPHHAAAALWRTLSAHAAEQASWDMADLSARVNDLARPGEGPPKEQSEARSRAQQSLTFVRGFIGDHVRTHAARGHLHTLAASLITLDQVHRTLMDGIWNIAHARRAQHNPETAGPWTYADELRATADLDPVVQAGKTRLEKLRRHHLDLTQRALADLIPDIRDISPTSHRHYMMRNHLAPLDLLGTDLRQLDTHLVEKDRRAVYDIRTALKAPRAPIWATEESLAHAERRLQTTQRRITDTQIEFALSVTVGRTFDQVRASSPPESPAESQSRAATEQRRSLRAEHGHHSQAATAGLPAPRPTVGGMQ